MAPRSGGDSRAQMSDGYGMHEGRSRHADNSGTNFSSGDANATSVPVMHEYVIYSETPQGSQWTEQIIVVEEYPAAGYGAIGNPQLERARILQEASTRRRARVTAITAVIPQAPRKRTAHHFPRRIRQRRAEIRWRPPPATALPLLRRHGSRDATSRKGMREKRLCLPAIRARRTPSSPPPAHHQRPPRLASPVGMNCWRRSRFPESGLASTCVSTRRGERREVYGRSSGGHLGHGSADGGRFVAGFTSAFRQRE